VPEEEFLMTLKVTGFASTALPYKLVTETASTNTLNSNVTGASGVVYSFDVVNLGNNDGYFKCYLSSTGAILGAAADLKIRLQNGANGAKKVIMPAGIAFTELSFFLTETTAQANSQTAPTTAATVSSTTT
jgi:hypothetical protein